MSRKFVKIICRELKRQKWSKAELDRRAGLSIGESRRFLAGERDLASRKVEAMFNALGLVIRKA